MHNLTQQGKAIQKLLAKRPIKKGAMSAKEIAADLGVLPNAVYRSIAPLVRFGFVKTQGKYPIMYTAQDPQGAAEIFAESQKNEVLHSIAVPERLSGTEGVPEISFVNDRDQLIEKSNKDILRARSGVCFIVSGLEVPAETVLAYARAIERGVRVRIIIQNLKEAAMLKNWQRMGIDIKQHHSIDSRIIIIDSSVVYVTSYSSKQKNEATGVRFAYLPIAVIMQEFFEREWLKSKPL